MTNSNNEQDLIFRAKFEDEASEDLEGLGDEVEELDKGMGSLSLSSVTAGLAMFGMGVGVNKVVGAVSESIVRMGALRATMSLLPEAARTALEDMGPAFLQIGEDMGATSLEVEEVAAAISASSGGIVPSIKNIELAFALMKLRGLEAGAAADIVGQALQGNEEPLNTLLDPGGRSYISLIAAQEKFIPIAKDVKTPIDDMTAAFRDLGQKAGTWAGIIDVLNGKENPSFDPDPDQKGFTGFGNLIDIATEWIAKQQELKDNPLDLAASEEAAAGLREELNLIIADAEILKALGVDNPEDFTSVPITKIEGVGSFGELTGATINVTINGDVDSAQRAANLARQIDLQLRNIYRGSINTLADSRLLPS